MSKTISLNESAQILDRRFPFVGREQLLTALQSDQIEAKYGVVEFSRSRKARFRVSVNGLPSEVIEKVERERSDVVSYDGFTAVAVKNPSAWACYEGFEQYSLPDHNKDIYSPYWINCEVHWDENRALFWSLTSFERPQEYSFQFSAQKIVLSRHDVLKITNIISDKREIELRNAGVWPDATLALLFAVSQLDFEEKRQFKWIKAALDRLSDNGITPPSASTFAEFAKYFFSRSELTSSIITTPSTPPKKWDMNVRIEIAAWILAGQFDPMILARDASRLKSPRGERIYFDPLPFIHTALEVASEDRIRTRR